MAVHNERRVQAFPHPKIVEKLNDYSTINGMSKSKVVNMALKSFFENMPAKEKVHLANSIVSKNSY